MNKRLFNGAMVILSFLFLGFLPAQKEWQKKTSGIYETSINFVAADPNNSNLIYAGTSHALYKSFNGAQSFFPALRLHGSFQNVNFIYIAPDNPNIIYTATNDGLMLSLDQGRKWRKIFDSFDPGSRVCHCVISDGETIYLGTGKGFFIKKGARGNWQKQDGDLWGQPVYRLAQNAQNIYLSTDSEVYSLEKADQSQKKILSLGSKEIEEIHTENDDLEVNANERRIRDLVKIGEKIWVAADTGIYVSNNQGASWDRLEQTGLPVEALTSLAVLPSWPAVSDEDSLTGEQREPIIFAGTSKGVFIHAGARWEQVYQGMETNSIHHLAADSNGSLYAATNRGIFFVNPEKALTNLNPMQNSESTRKEEKPSTNVAAGSNPNGLGQSHFDYKEAQNKFKNEPTIQEVQRLAIDYADTRPDKISQWRDQAKKSAWLPSFSVGLDGDRNRTLADSVYGTYSGGGQSYIGPDDKTFYDNFGWSATLSWDLSELIWNPDQTSIDSRSKLMVELRQDVLDQITRLYFERRRLQMELTAFPEEDETMIIEKQMRIDELTALIDGFTGGQFSRSME